MQGAGLDGPELLDLVKELDPDLPVVMIAGHGNIETAVSAIKRSDLDLLEKPFKSDRLLLVVERALEAASLPRANRRLRTLSATPDGFPRASTAAQHLRQTIAKVAPANSRVLITRPSRPRQGNFRSPDPRATTVKGEFVPVSAATREACLRDSAATAGRVASKDSSSDRQGVDPGHKQIHQAVHYLVAEPGRHERGNWHVAVPGGGRKAEILPCPGHAVAGHQAGAGPVRPGRRARPDEPGSAAAGTSGPGSRSALPWCRARSACLRAPPRRPARCPRGGERAAPQRPHPP